MNVCMYVCVRIKRRNDEVTQMKLALSLNKDLHVRAAQEKAAEDREDRIRKVNMSRLGSRKYDVCILYNLCMYACIYIENYVFECFVNGYLATVPRLFECMYVLYVSMYLCHSASLSSVIDFYVYVSMYVCTVCGDIQENDLRLQEK